MKCGSCDKEIEGSPESCWFCDSYLCYACWEEKGHCGHSEAEAINQASRLTDWRGRQKLIKALHPDMEMLGDTEDEEVN